MSANQNISFFQGELHGLSIKCFLKIYYHTSMHLFIHSNWNKVYQLSQTNVCQMVRSEAWLIHMIHILIKVVFNLKVNWFFNYFLYCRQKWNRSVVSKISPCTFLNIGLNLAILLFSEKADSFIVKFIIFLQGRANISAIWSIPAALLVSRLNKTFLITSPDTFDNSKSLVTLHEVLAYYFWLFG